MKINNIREITFESLRVERNYLISENKNYEIHIYNDSVQIQNHTDNVKYCYKLDTPEFSIHFTELLELAEDFETVEEFISKIREFKYFREYPCKEYFNPFYKELKGKIELKSKENRFNKAQLKKLLKHVDSKVITEYEYSDDYLTDAELNFKNNAEIERNKFLQRICEYGSYTITQNSEKELRVFDGNNLYIVKNKMLNII